MTHNSYPYHSTALATSFVEGRRGVSSDRLIAAVERDLWKRKLCQEATFQLNSRRGTAKSVRTARFDDAFILSQRFGSDSRCS
jgi:hypothetical protein